MMIPLADTAGHPYFPPVDVAEATEPPVWAEGHAARGKRPRGSAHYTRGRPARPSLTQTGRAARGRGLLSGRVGAPRYMAPRCPVYDVMRRGPAMSQTVDSLPYAGRDGAMDFPQPGARVTQTCTSPGRRARGGLAPGELRPRTHDYRQPHADVEHRERRG